jgi:hypothetical protein
VLPPLHPSTSTRDKTAVFSTKKTHEKKKNFFFIEQIVIIFNAFQFDFATAKSRVLGLFGGGSSGRPQRRVDRIDEEAVGAGFQERTGFNKLIIVSKTLIWRQILDFVGLTDACYTSVIAQINKKLFSSTFLCVAAEIGKPCPLPHSP